MISIKKNFVFTLITALMALPIYASTPPNDAEIAHRVVTANTIDIDAGKLALKRGNSKIKEFAQLMVTDHSAVNKQAVALVTKLGVKPEDNATSKSLLSGAKENINNLKKLKGDKFDKEYVDHEVAYHQAVIDEIDSTLIPNSKNSELNALLVKVRPAFVAHLEHAKSLQSSLNN